MPAPTITLPRPYVLISPSASGLGLVTLPGNTMRFGTVALTYSTSDRVSVGDSVIFDTKNASQYLYGSTFYWMVEDKFVTGQEVIVP